MGTLGVALGCWGGAGGGGTGVGGSEGTAEVRQAWGIWGAGGDTGGQVVGGTKGGGTLGWAHIARREGTWWQCGLTRRPSLSPCQAQQCCRPHNLPLLRAAQQREMEAVEQRIREEQRMMDEKIVLELDQKVIDQQSTLEKAGVSGFYITTNPQVGVEAGKIVLGFPSASALKTCEQSPGFFSVVSTPPQE
uniref:Uncharacterized protein n=1 Tax=Falco tinnunculus TaxID=100819 RepID=A0A8C4UAM0_FALTI